MVDIKRNDDRSRQEKREKRENVIGEKIRDGNRWRIEKSGEKILDGR